MKKTMFTTSILITILLTSITAYAVTQNITTLQNVGVAQILSSHNIGVYKDYACNVSITSLNWGTVPIPGLTQQTFYVRNNDNKTLTLDFLMNNYSNNSFIEMFNPICGFNLSRIILWKYWEW